MIAPKLKYVSIDIETTGLNPDTCQVLELGAVIEDWISPIDKLPTFRRILFNKPIVGEPFALALNANLLKLIANPPTELEYLFVKPDDLGYDFANWLSQNNIDPKHIQPAGKNFAAFDAQFLNRLSRFNEYVKFNHRTIDPSMLFWHLDDEGLPGTKECMERAGIDGKVAHTAVEDAIAVIKMVRYWANTQ
jgi:DNA polymerase III alpha subunit (gram-positive type)